MLVFPVTKSEMSSYRELILQREALDKKIEFARAAELKTVVSDIRRKMQDYGVTLSDLGIYPKRRNQSRACMRVEPKYYNPENPNQQWSGRGKEPRWIAGKNRTDFLIHK